MSDPSDSFTTPTFIPQSTNLQSPTPVGPEDPIAGLRGAIGWQYAWPTAIALAWASEDRRQELKNDPREFFRVWANYKLPEGLTLHVEETPQKPGELSGWDPEKGCWYLKKSVLTMFLPPRPNVDQQAIALAAYNATARAYPFTIC
jgi:ribosomally synthesized peptide (two-chain TOMM family)